MRSSISPAILAFKVTITTTITVIATITITTIMEMEASMEMETAHQMHLSGMVTDVSLAICPTTGITTHSDVSHVPLASTMTSLRRDVWLVKKEKPSTSKSTNVSEHTHCLNL